MRRALLVVAIGACGDETPAPMPSEHDGFQRIDVAMPDSTTDPMWIYVASPPGEGPFPVVVYGHGQGVSNAFPACAAESAPPTHDDVEPSVDVARSLADAGYVGIAVMYRGFGEPPVPGEVITRDHFVLDARAFLSAARWARDTHEKASDRVAFMGQSMGSFPATWSVSSHPGLADLQAGLDIRTAVASGMLGNHIANSSPQFSYLDEPAIPVETRVAGTLLFSLLLPSIRAGGLRLDASNLTGFAGDLTPAGLGLVRASFFDAPPAVPECEGVTIPYCSSSCLNRIVADEFASIGATDVRSSDWFTADTAAAFEYWSPPDRIDPGVSSSTLLARLRAISPAYSLPSVLPGVRMLPLLSTNDHTIPVQLGTTTEALDLYIDHLRGAGAVMPPSIPSVSGDGCDHGDYYLPDRPQCGWDLVTDELAAAFD